MLTVVATTPGEMLEIEVSLRSRKTYDLRPMNLFSTIFKIGKLVLKGIACKSQPYVDTAHSVSISNLIKSFKKLD
jgi:hypothetical protein